MGFIRLYGQVMAAATAAVWAFVFFGAITGNNGVIGLIAAVLAGPLIFWGIGYAYEFTRNHPDA